MDSKTWERIERLFFEALDTAPSERAAFLDAACADDAALRAELDAMLAAHEDGADSGLDIERTLLNEGGAARELAGAAREGDRIGAWRLVRPLGRGGMGEVWLASRADGAFEQDAAVKLVRPGWRSTELAARFRRERQLLARLAHPNIAKLLDGGVTDDGLPFLVMEYVDGEPITTWCESHRVPPRERLALVRVVCEAVRFAHANLVVHRDLKPANILVTKDGRPILLDFGIAKLLDPEDSSAAPTRADDRLLTPEHAAPEQLRGEPATTATDVWGLGSLLYELLTDRRPFDVAGKSATAIERIVCEGEAPRASSVASPESSRLLRGDLDVILGTALRREPERRFRSVEQFAEDLDRFLAGLPVRSRPDTVGYRARKFARRHRAALAATCAFVLLLLAFAGSSWRQSRAVARERDKAVAANDDSQHAIAMLVDLFSLANPRVTPGGDSLRVDDLLRLMTDKIVASKESPRVRAKLWSTIAEIHGARTRLAEAESATVRGIQAAEEGRLVEESLLLKHQRARIVLFRHGAKAAEPLFRESARAHEAHYGPNHLEMVPVLVDWASSLEGRDEAAGLLEKALANVLSRPDQPGLLASVYNSIGANHWAAGRVADARDAFSKSYATLAEAMGEDNVDLLSVRNNLAVCESATGRFADAEKSHRSVLAMREKVFGDSSYFAGASWMSLGVELANQGKFEESARVLETAVAIGSAAIGPDHREVLDVRCDLAAALARGRHVEEGLAIYDDVIRIWMEKDGPDSFDALHVRVTRISAELFAGRPVSASEPRAIVNRLRGEGREPMLADAIGALGRAALASPETALPGEAEAALREVLALREKTTSPEHPLIPSLRLSVDVARAASAGGAAKTIPPIDADSLAASIAACEKWGLVDPSILRRARILLADVRSGR